MRRSIATVSLSGTLEEKLRAADLAGFDGVEVFESDLVSSPLRPEDVRALAADLGLSIDLYQPFRDFEAVPPDLLARNLRRASAKLDVMERLGTTTLLVCSNCSAAAMDDDALAAAQLRELAEVAAERGMRIAYEALAWGRHVDDYLHAWRIVAAADHPSLGLCLDSFHILSRGTDPAGIERIPADRLFFLQLADAPNPPMDVLQWSRHHRRFPGQGDLDLQGLVGHVLAAGYTGPLSIEVFNDVFRVTDARRAARDAMRSLLALEESLPPSPRVELCRPPAPAELRGFTFVEIGVDDASAGAVEALLRSLGFSRAGRHRTKPVQLWRQGDARVLLNAGEQRLDGRLRGDATVVALGVESADPARSAERARTLLAPVRPRTFARGEADLAEIAAPDGMAVFFCHTEVRDPASWIGDFQPLPEGAAAPAAAGLLRIDHVELSQPFGHFEEAALFFGAVLGLRRLDQQELATPYGLQRASTLSNPDGVVRIALDVPLLGDAGQSPECHHVALACDDVLATARSLRALGAPLLAIPENYYDDVAARFDLQPELVEAMRAHGVLYERDESGGELFHLYTAIVGRRLFFEVVQRSGGYAGMGAQNAPVRMASQRASRLRGTQDWHWRRI
jgi:4-hydroxyphenylpyruvate dioxygenase